MSHLSGPQIRHIFAYGDFLLFSVQNQPAKNENNCATAVGRFLRVSIYTVTEHSSGANHAFSLVQYRQLAELRFHIRRYLQFSEQNARTHGIEPQQHQLMLTIKGLPANTIPTVSALANRLCLRHHSTVELINRLVERGAAIRKQSTQDRRQVLVELTPQGEELLANLNAHHSQELQTFAPELLTQLNTVMTTSFAEPTTSETIHKSTASSDSDSSGAVTLESAATNAN